MVKVNIILREENKHDISKNTFRFFYNTCLHSSEIHLYTNNQLFYLLINNYSNLDVEP